MTTTLRDPSVSGPQASPASAPTADTSPDSRARYLWALTRLCLGWTFLWSFLDDTFGLGHDTPSADAWIDGGSPTSGYLEAASGPFAGAYQDLSGVAWVDWAFMLGILLIGVALLLGIGMRIAAVSGAVLLVLMWGADLPTDWNPFIDQQIIYALVLLGLAVVGAGKTLGFGRQWADTNLVRKHPWLA